MAENKIQVIDKAAENSLCSLCTQQIHIQFSVCSPFQRQSPGNYGHILRKTHGQQHLWSEDS